MKTALFSGLLTIAASAHAGAALHCQQLTRAFAASLTVESTGEDLIAGTFSHLDSTVAFQGKYVRSNGPTSTYALAGGTLTSLEITETVIPSPEPPPCPRCAGSQFVKTTAILHGAGVLPTEFAKCRGSIE